MRIRRLRQRIRTSKSHGPSKAAPPSPSEMNGARSKRANRCHSAGTSHRFVNSATRSGVFCRPLSPIPLLIPLSGGNCKRSLHASDRHPPSPTAAAQRFTERSAHHPLRKYRPSWSQAARRCLYFSQAGASRRGSVLMNPFSSRSISGGNQSVHGFAPIIEKTAGVVRAPLAGLRILAQQSQACSARHLSDSVSQDLDFSCDRRVAKDNRHALGEIIAADDEQNFGWAFRKEHRGLPRGITATDNDDGFVAAKLTFHGGCGVVNAHAFESLAAFGVESLIIRARSDEDAFCAEQSRTTFDLKTSGIPRVMFPATGLVPGGKSGPNRYACSCDPGQIDTTIQWKPKKSRYEGTRCSRGIALQPEFQSFGRGVTAAARPVDSPTIVRSK